MNLKGMTKVDTLLHNLHVQHKFPGLAITVLREGNTIFQKGYGYADVENKLKVNPKHTIFRIASVSKPIAATALAHMVQDGILDLDESFYTYLPDYPKKEWDFTIRQLASHTAGIRVYKGKEYGLNEPFSIKEGLGVFKNDPLVFEPDTEYLYNSFDWIMISAAMQEASGIPFEQYIQEKVLNPLGMQKTFYPKCHHERSRSNEGTELKEGTEFKEPENVANFYTKCLTGFRKAIPVNNFYKLAGGGYLSTSADIAKFGQAYLEKSIEVKAEILDQFLTSREVHGQPTYYGLGWQVSEDAKGRKFYGHVGNGIGGYSNFFVYPEEQLVFSILINCTDPKIQPELDVVINCFFNSIKS